jgi:uncharacterized membrane protein YvlD (DUF360 family)
VATLGITGLCFALFAAGRIEVTESFAEKVAIGLMGLLVVYLLSALLQLAGVPVGSAFDQGIFGFVVNAISIGLLAPVPVERVQRVGNAALHGAAGLLLSKSRRDVLDSLIGRIEHVELETEEDFFELFVDGCRFVPIAA